MIRNQYNIKDRLSDLMVKIPSGEISLRDDRTKQKWTETINSFNLSKYLITQDFFYEVTSENSSTFKGCNQKITMS
jgi:hypothetical protein